MINKRQHYCNFFLLVKDTVFKLNSAKICDFSLSEHTRQVFVVNGSVGCDFLPWSEFQSFGLCFFSYGLYSKLSGNGVYYWQKKREKIYKEEEKKEKTKKQETEE